MNEFPWQTNHGTSLRKRFLSLRWCIHTEDIIHHNTASLNIIWKNKHNGKSPFLDVGHTCDTNYGKLIAMLLGISMAWNDLKGLPVYNSWWVVFFSATAEDPLKPSRIGWDWTCRNLPSQQVIRALSLVGWLWFFRIARRNRRCGMSWSLFKYTEGVCVGIMYMISWYMMLLYYYSHTHSLSQRKHWHSSTLIYPAAYCVHFATLHPAHWPGAIWYHTVCTDPKQARDLVEVGCPLCPND